MNMGLLVRGAGGVGGHFGAQQAAAGVDLTFLVWPARAERDKTPAELAPQFDVHPNQMPKPVSVQPYPFGPSFLGSELAYHCVRFSGAT